MEHLDVPAVLEALARLRIQLNDFISEPDVAGFEQKHGIFLPPDYREFITRIGNGEVYLVSFVLYWIETRQAAPLR